MHRQEDHVPIQYTVIRIVPRGRVREDSHREDRLITPGSSPIERGEDPHTPLDAIGSARRVKCIRADGFACRSMLR